MSVKEDVSFFEAYLRELESSARTIEDLCLSDFITPEKILSEIPTQVEQERQLRNEAEYLAKDAKKANPPTRANRLAKYAKALADPNVRSKRAECLVLRKKRITERRIKNLSKPDANAKRAAQLANDNGFDGGIFFKAFDDPTSLQSKRNLSKQIETIPQIIAAIEKPKDRSIIPDSAKLLTVPQVAGILNCGESVVRQRDKKGLLPLSVRIEGTILWNRYELSKWIDAGCPPRQKWEQIKQGKEM